MARNVQLQTKDGLNIYPKTFATNIYMSDGRTLEDMLHDILNGKNIVFEPYQLPISTKYSLGGVIVGNGLEIDKNGVLSCIEKGTGVYGIIDMAIA